MPPDRSVDFDFTKRGLLVFADKSVAAGSVYTPCSSPEPKASTFTPNLGVNEFNAIIQQMAKVRLSGLVNQTYFPLTSNFFLQAFGVRFQTHSCLVYLGAWCLLGSKSVEVLSITFPCERQCQHWKRFGGVVYFFSFANFLVLLSTKHTNVEKKFQLPENFSGIW